MLKWALVLIISIQGLLGYYLLGSESSGAGAAGTSLAELIQNDSQSEQKPLAESLAKVAILQSEDSLATDLSEEIQGRWMASTHQLGEQDPQDGASEAFQAGEALLKTFNEIPKDDLHERLNTLRSVMDSDLIRPEQKQMFALRQIEIPTAIETPSQEELELVRISTRILAKQWDIDQIATLWNYNIPLLHSNPQVLSVMREELGLPQAE